MVNSNQFTVPVGTRLSVGVELEFLIPWLPSGKKDPLGSEAASLPPLLRMDPATAEEAEDAAKETIRKLLRKHGVPVAKAIYDRRQADEEDEDEDNSDPATFDRPFRLKHRDKWYVGTDSSVKEYFNKDYNWEAIEIQSPALWARPECFEEVQFVVNVLTTSYRLRVNPSCGFHVHVGNGRFFFPPQHIKRIGTFLWAADPMISRLHAPWRRVIEFSRSIRYESVLSGGATGESIEELHKEWDGKYDPQPMTDFSNTTREEKEFGSKEKWEEFARWRNEAGPFMTLGDDTDDIGNVDSKDDNNRGGSHDNDSSRGKNNNDSGSDGSHGDNTGGTSNHSEHISTNVKDLEESIHNSTLIRQPPEDLLTEIAEPEPSLPSIRDVIIEISRLLEEDRKVHVPADPNALHRNIGWVRWDELQPPEVTDWIRDYCAEVHGHRNIEQLDSKEQLSLMIRTQCAYLFGHTKLESLTKSQEYQVLVASAPYVEAGRSRWDWNPTTKTWERNWQRFGYILDHPNARREINIDAPYIVTKFENMAKLLELDNDISQSEIEYVDRREHDRAIQTNSGMEELLKSLKDYADSPGPHYLENLVDSDVSLYYALGTSPPPPTTAPLEEGEVPPTTKKSSSEGSDSSPLSKVPLDDDSTKESVQSSFISFTTNDSSDSSDGSFHPPAWDAVQAELSHSPPAFWVPSPKPRADKLLPHDADALSSSYKTTINKYLALTDSFWDDIGYLPLTTHPLAGSAASYVFKRPVPEHIGKVTTVEGMAEIASSKSSMVIAELLSHEGMNYRLNYSFTFYRQISLRGAEAMGHESVNMRTIEFREAAGTLDAQWISVWMRVCLGIVRWSTSAQALDFITVTNKITDQEQRDLRKLAAGGARYDAQEQDEADRYDVCDLLEDMGLYAEAAWIRKREREKGPPR
ncbi:putative amidoligase enzyme-domain-containing protein [Hypoxylon sp. NC0597]|nr:putative amidoligase enzyme-domain-containing protein [Hypoxylon sp. NC0597]